jgi:antitoxin component YwqK of YwqJK toxin-antitoxin module
MKNWISIFSLATVSLILSGCHKQQCCQYEPWQSDVVNEEYIHTYGIPVDPDSWMNRGQNGQVVSTLRNGIVVRKNFRDGCLEGDTTYSYPYSGAIQRVESYSKGCLIKDREHNASGAPNKEREYHTDSSYTLRTWYDNGSPQSRETYDNNRLIEADYYTMNNQVESRINDGLGNRIIRDEFGTLVRIDKFENGEMILSTGYFPNGTPREEIPYRNGQIDGPRKTYFPGGEPLAVEGWVGNCKEGITVLYQNGEKVAEVPYFNNQKNGVEQRYKDGNIIVEEITWKHDRKHGPSYSYLGPDNVRVDWYYNGKLVTKSQYDRYLHPQL